GVSEEDGGVAHRLAGDDILVGLGASGGAACSGSLTGGGTAACCGRRGGARWRGRRRRAGRQPEGDQCGQTALLPRTNRCHSESRWLRVREKGLRRYYESGHPRVRRPAGARGGPRPVGAVILLPVVWVAVTLFRSGSR